MAKRPPIVIVPGKPEDEARIADALGDALTAPVADFVPHMTNGAQPNLERKTSLPPRPAPRPRNFFDDVPDV
jgi:hypothetical protein